MPNATLPKFRDVGDTNSPPTMSAHAAPDSSNAAEAVATWGQNERGRRPKRVIDGIDFLGCRRVRDKALVSEICIKMAPVLI